MKYKAVFLGDPNVEADKQTVMASTQQELQKEVERISAQLKVNPANWYGDGYQDIERIPADVSNAWAREVFGIVHPSITTWEGVFEDITGREPTEEDLKLKSQYTNRGQIEKWFNKQKDVPIDMPGLPEPVTPPATEEPTEDTGFEAVTPENQVNPIQIQEIYQQYAGREATEAEIEWHTQTHPISYNDLLNWATTAPEVAAEYELNVTEKQARYDEGLAIINDSNLPDDQKELWRTLYENYDGDTVDVQQILDTFEKVKTDTIDPYWQGLIDLAEQDFRYQLDTITGRRERELETEQATKEQRLKGAQASLEARGMTFSGEAVEQLGTRSGTGTAYGEEGTGLLGQQSRLISSASAAEYARQTQELGMGIESQLGSAGLGQFNIPDYTQVGTVEGQLPTQQEGAQASYLNQLLRNAYGVSQYNQ